MILMSSARTILDSREVGLDRFSGRVAPPAVHLRPSRDAGLDLVAQHVLRNSVLELLDEIRPFGPRAHDRHVAPQHVPELGQLVEVDAAQPAAHRRASGIVVTRPDRPLSSSAPGYSIGTFTWNAGRRAPCAPACRRPAPWSCIDNRGDEFRMGSTVLTARPAE